MKNLVDMLEGDVQVRSSKGHGTTFVVTLPVKDRARVLRPLDASQRVKPEALFDESLKVLLVEDNHTNAFILQAFCKKYKMQVDWSKDGLEAMEYLSDNNYDLILMDNQLPHLGGIETTHEIRQNLRLGTLFTHVLQILQKKPVTHLWQQGRTMCCSNRSKRTHCTRHLSISSSDS